MKFENEILALRKRFPSWGARKLKARLEKKNPNVVWPAASTIGQILRRAGLTNPVRKRRRTTPYSEPFAEVTAPNQPWCMDFKGWFRTGDGHRCDPFTITDALQPLSDSLSGRDPDGYCSGPCDLRGRDARIWGS